MIKKFRVIPDFGIFKNFEWDTVVKDKRNNVVEFKKMNIIYGRNYSGKTTLSRILRCCENGVLHEKYPTCQFEIQTARGQLDQNNLRDPFLHIRVYNEDFIKDNLRWLIDEQGNIKPFAIIGEKNIELEKRIRNLEAKLGNEESATGLKHSFKLQNEEYEKKLKERNEAQKALDGKLRDKANNSIKRNPIYSDVTYNIANIRADIEYLLKNKALTLKEDQVQSLKELLKEEAKPKVSPPSRTAPSFETLLEPAKELLSKSIKPSVPIQELLNDAVLALWVRSGMELHRDKRKICGFCGQTLPNDLWAKLDAHFSKESEGLRKAINNHIIAINEEKENASQPLSLKSDQFYSTFKGQFEAKEKEWNSTVKKYCKSLDKLLSGLNERLKDIFKVKTIGEPEDSSQTLSDLEITFNELIEENNKKTDTLKKDQEKARKDLRLNEVGNYINDIGYLDWVKKIANSGEEENRALELKNATQEEIIKTESEIEDFKTKMKDEKKGADRVNEYLSHYFGHNGLRLAAQEEGMGYNFVIKRGDNIAYNLSEGERTLVAFCYFMARLEDTESQGKELVVWIDDPVSSLDSNHIFFVFSLIENIIAAPKKLSDGSQSYAYKQLFISTHNLDFLKYLRRLSYPKNGLEYFLVEGSNEKSILLKMPDYLKKYITEFNYLFHQIYKCATISNPETEHDCFYNFGNNLRKFLEAYLFYKYPSDIKIEAKINAFFGGNKVSVEIANRLENELSHLYEIFDRSMKPIEIPEIPKLAKYVLDRIKEKDGDQYKELLRSIEVEPSN